MESHERNSVQKRNESYGQNLTLRQIGAQFPDIDTVFLRQAWADIRASQRCTRSRAKQSGY
ncbi:hypothetical protein N7539_008408 [Penicillium diatomitis]|uniref:Uncharacterized protein n=1 Tax=Penicillium diatomitis TaxID=2819901 RepID=A0A9W9WUH5_9EURO|nr:uncharacterized protein N7539_008408 [Penicillium diatomitis]KAJ5475342.1 hypothetical protein N7539_008408 [Penicillium diatomitis]